MPRVSVIIPAHNAAAFLPAALGSVRAQTFTDWEVVAVDDGSSDDTWSVLQGAGPRVRALRNAGATGPAGARNRAIAEATGELVAFLDADDLLQPTYLERQIACFDAAKARGQHVGLVACDALMLEGDTYGRKTYLDIFGSRDGRLTLERVLSRNPIYNAALVPAEVGESVGWFDFELFGTEDFGLWLKILERGFEAILNPETLAVYRCHSGTVSSNLTRQAENVCRTYELALARGFLNPHQRRIARRAIRYNRAIEAIAKVRFGSTEGHPRAELFRLAPMLAWVAATNPRQWRRWLTILRVGRVPVVGDKPRAGSP